MTTRTKVLSPEGRREATTSPRRRGYGVTMSSAEKAFYTSLLEGAGQAARFGAAAVAGGVTLAATRNRAAAVAAVSSVLGATYKVETVYAPDGRKPGRPRGGTR